MKKYNYFILTTILCYLIIAFFSGYFVYQKEDQRSQEYQVEINRFLTKIQKDQAIDDLSSYQYLTKVERLDLDQLEPEQLTSFLQEKDHQKFVIRPYIQDGNMIGYLKITYQQQTLQLLPYLVILEGSLFLLAMLIICFLCYLKKHVIRPFHSLNELPKQLAQGHLKNDIQIQKGKYYQDFLWGMSQLKDELDSSRHRQLQLMKDKKTMLLSLSHDIKTPLNLIKLYVQALEKGLYKKEQEYKQALCQVEEKAMEIEHYVEQITKSSTEELIDLPVLVESFYLKDLLDNVKNSYKEICSSRHIELKIGKYKNHLLKGDFHRSQEVLENLLENAIKYGDGKKIEFSFSEEDYCTLLHVFNTGVPITDNEFNHLFDSFFRGSNAQRHAGSGLGLYICRELMRKMEGSIYAEKQDHGMTFIVVFPKDM